MSDPIMLEKKEEGIFISISSEVHLSDVLDFLSREQIAVSNPDSLEYLIAHPGEMVLVSDKIDEKEARINVDIPRDSLTVRVSIEPPMGKKSWPGFEDIRSVLDAKNVNYGIDDQAIARMIGDKISNTWVTVARGLPPLNGRNAVIDYRVDFGNKKPVASDENEKVNLKELSSVTLIAKDQLLAVREPHTEGSDGISVFGKTIKAKHGKNVKMPAGEGTYQSEDGMELYSAIDGHLLIRGGKLDVLAVYVVPGDVDYSVGNIHFTGSVDVNGAVRDGFEIKTTGNIMVNGVIEGAILETDNDLNVKIGITAGNKGNIKVGGDISAGYIDKATVSAGGNVTVRDVVLHSNLYADGYISVGTSGGKGQLMGGSLMAGLGVCCTTLGSEMGTRTEVQVGVSPNLVNRKNELKKLMDDNRNNLQKINSNLTFLKKVDKAGKLDNEKRAIMLKLTKGSFQIQSLLKQWNDEFEDVEKKIDRNRTNAKISVKKNCYPGVSISMRGLTYLVREKLKFVTFLYEDGEIKQISYTP